MRFLSRFLTIAFLLAAFVLSQVQTARQRIPELSPNQRTAVLLVGFRDGTTAEERAAVVSSIGGIDVKTIGAGTHVVYVGQGRENAAMGALKKYRAIRYVEPDFIHHLAGGAAPNDTFAGYQWAISNTGQTINGSAGSAGADERSSLAWRVTTGTNAVVVAVLDTGVQYSHPDLVTNMWNNPGGIGGCPAATHGYNVLAGSCDPMDDDAAYGGHGTHVAGILGAAGNNQAGVSGVNWTTSIMAVKWVDSNNTGYTSDLIAAMDWVLRAKQAGVNVRVANDSATWPGTAASQALSDEIDLLGSNDILLVTAAGNTAQNNDTTPRYPCSYNRLNMICAGASDQNDRLWGSSNYGITTVKLGAPGVNIYSTLRQSNYGYISGGSMAAPQVSGTAALILSEGYQSVANLRALILNNVDGLQAFQGLVATAGRLNVCKAVPGCSSGATATPGNIAPPVITGVVQLGSILGVSTGVWSGLPTQYAYQWYRCGGSPATCTAIAGAAYSSYSPIAGPDIGASLAVKVTASNSMGSNVAWSSGTPVILLAGSPFAITSTIHDGDTISGAMRWQASPALMVNFVQFYIDGVLAQTLSSSPFVYNYNTTGYLDTASLGAGRHVLGIRALSADNRTYGFYGAAVTVQNPPQNFSAPVVSGMAVQGQTLSTSNGSWMNSPASFTYQWNRCNSSGSNCSSIAGATGSSYNVAGADVGFTLRSAVTAINSAGSNTALSIPTSVVTGSGGTTGGGITLLQSNAVRGTAVGSVSAGFSNGNQPGNLIIAVVRMSTTVQSVNVTDSSGNVYADAVTQAQTADGHQVHLFYAKNIAGGPNTVTATFSATNNHPWLAIYEYSGLSVTNPLDQTAHAQGSGTVVDTGATPATNSSNELVFAATGLPASYSGTAASGSPYLLEAQDTGSSRAATEAAMVNSTGSFDGIFNLNPAANWSAVVATFKSAGSAGPPPPDFILSISPASQTVTQGGSTAFSVAVTSQNGFNGTVNLSAAGFAPGAGGTFSTPAITGSGSSTLTISTTPSAQTGTFTFNVTGTSGALTHSATATMTITAAGAAPIAQVQSNAVEGTGIASQSVSFLAPNHAGNLIVAIVRMSTTSQTVSVSDTQGNTYIDAVSQAQTADGHQIHLFYARAIAAGANTVTAAFSSINNHPWVAVYEFSGLSTTNPLDQVAHAQGSGSGPNSGATPVTSSPNELVVAITGLPASYTGSATAGSGYSLQLQDTGTSRAATEAATTTSTGSYAGVFNLSTGTNWSAVVATFKP